MRFVLLLATLSLSYLCGQAVDSCQLAPCTGPEFVTYLEDPDGNDLKGNCLLADPTGGFFLGGTVDDHLYLSKINEAGVRLWERKLPTGSEATQLFVLNRLILDSEGMLIGGGTVFNAPTTQRGFLFRYHPLTHELLYYRELDTESEITCIFEQDDEASLLLLGAQLSEPAPVFERKLSQLVDRNTGSPLAPADLYDLGGKEQIVDAVRHADKIYSTGVYTLPNVGSGGFRAGLSQLDPQGQLLETLTGHQDAGFSSRLLGFDVEIVEQTIYLLSWGSTDIISGDVGTKVILSAFDLTANPLWSVQYDMPDFSGEIGVELTPHDGGLVFYGYVLTGRRDLLLTQVDPDGNVEWSKAYELPGNSVLNWRGNQQMISTPDGLLCTATYTESGLPDRIVLLKTDEEGQLTNPCLNVRELQIEQTLLSATWTDYALEQSQISPQFIQSTAVAESLQLDRITSCETPCCTPCTGMEGIGDFEVATLCEGEQYLFIDTLIGSSGRFIRNNFCNGTDTLEITLLPAVPLTNLDLTICAGDTVRVGNNDYTTAGLFFDTLQTALTGCDSLIMVNVMSRERASSFESREICSGDSVFIFGVYRQTAGRYRATYPLDTEVCDSLAVIDLIVHPSPDLFVEQLANCSMATTQLSLSVLAGSPPFSLLWSDGTEQLTERNLLVGSYGVSVTDAAGCATDLSIEVLQNNSFNFFLVSDTVMALGSEWLISPSISGIDAGQLGYQWSSEDFDLSCTDCERLPLSITGSGSISLQLTAENGCTQTRTIRISADAHNAVYLPNAFSPNGDGINDRFEPAFGPGIAKVNRFEVYDRWGGRVYSRPPSSELSDSMAWDGTKLEKRQPSGVYVYLLEAELLNGQKILRSGEVMLMR